MDWLAAICSILGCVLNAKKRIWCWPIWILANVLWTAYALMTHQYSFILLNGAYACLNIYGWCQWRKLMAPE